MTQCAFVLTEKKQGEKVYLYEDVKLEDEVGRKWGAVKCVIQIFLFCFSAWIVALVKNDNLENSWSVDRRFRSLMSD